MITLVFVTVFAVISVRQLVRRAPLRAWLGPLIGLLFLCLFAAEMVFRGRPLFISDEVYYLTEGEFANITEVLDRYLWVVLNALVLRYDWSFSGIPLKLINLPILALLVAFLWRIFDRDRLVWLVPVVLPYIAYMATFNLRDTAIITATAGCVYFLDDRRLLHRLSFLPCLAIVYLLRPQVAFLSAVVWLAILMSSGLGRIAYGRVPWKAVVVVGGGLLVALTLFAEPLLDRLVKYYVWYEYAFGEGFTDRALEQGLESGYLSASWQERIVLGVSQYTFAPLPTSLFVRALEGGSLQWGIVDDLVRVFHQTAYFGLLAYVLFRWRYWLHAVKALSRGQVMLLAAFVMYLPLYSVYQFGLTHQRVKIPFQLAVYLFAIVLHRTRDRYRYAKD